MRINQISSVNYNNSFRGNETSSMIRKLENLRAVLHFRLSIFPASKIYSDPKLIKIAENIAEVEAEIKRLKSGATSKRAFNSTLHPYN